MGIILSEEKNCSHLNTAVEHEALLLVGVEVARTRKGKARGGLLVASRGKGFRGIKPYECIYQLFGDKGVRTSIDTGVSWRQ